MTDDIFSAISANDKPTVAALIARDPGVAHARNQAGVSALMQALYENRREIIDLLRDAAGDLNIHEAAALGDIARLRFLLAEDASQINSPSNDGFSPLHLACFFRQLEAAQPCSLPGPILMQFQPVASRSFTAVLSKLPSCWSTRKQQAANG
jgi:ankyrin repeat protein